MILDRLLLIGANLYLSSSEIWTPWMFTNADVKMTLGLSIIGSITVTILIIVNKFWKQHLRKLIREGERAFDSNGWRKNDFEIRKPQFITKYFLKLPSNLKQIFCHATFWIITLGVYNLFTNLWNSGDDWFSWSYYSNDQFQNFFCLSMK